MGYKRTVRCSHCYQTGHNKSSCPEYKAKIEEYRSLGIMTATVEAYDRKKARKAAAAKTRKCSYCGEQGHNRASCAHLKAAISDFAGRNAQYRANVMAALINNGLGKGTMVEFEDYWGDKTVFMITNILWEQINMSDKRAGIFEARPIQRLNSQRSPRLMRLPKSVSTEWSGDNYKVLVKASRETTESSIPAGFIDGSLGVKGLFKDKSYSFHSMRDRWGDYCEKFDASQFNVDLDD